VICTGRGCETENQLSPSADAGAPGDRQATTVVTDSYEPWPLAALSIIIRSLRRQAYQPSGAPVRFFTPANPGHAGTLVGELISLASSQSPLRLAVRKTAVAIPVSVRDLAPR
jgi:hypothetical protein